MPPARDPIVRRAKPKRRKPIPVGPQGLPTQTSSSQRARPRVNPAPPKTTTGPQGLPTQGTSKQRPTTIGRAKGRGRVKRTAERQQRGRIGLNPDRAPRGGRDTPTAAEIKADLIRAIMEQRRRLGVGGSPSLSRPVADLAEEYRVQINTRARRTDGLFGLGIFPGVEHADARTGEKIGPDPSDLRSPHAWAARDAEIKKASAAAPVLKVLDQTTRPLHGVAAGVEAIATGKNVPGAVLAGLKNEKKTTFGELLRDAGAPKFLSGTLGFGLDVALDPTTYLTLGTGSIARKEALKAARQAEKGIREATATRPAATAREARRAAERLRGGGPDAPTLAERAARRAERQDKGRGVTVRFAGREVPGVRRASAVAGRSAGRAADKVAVPRLTREGRRAKGPMRPLQATRRTARELVMDVNPNIRPAGMTRREYEAVRQRTRTARHSMSRGVYEAQLRAQAIQKKIGKKNYELVVDAIEAGKIKTLPAELREPARFLAESFRSVRRQQRQAGIKVAYRKNYVPHLKTEDLTEAADRKTMGSASVGHRRVNPLSSKERTDNRTLAEIRVAEPGTRVDDPGVIFASRMAEGSTSKARAEFNRRLADTGREARPGKPISLRQGESLWEIQGSNIRKLDVKEAERLLAAPTIKRYSLGSRHAVEVRASELRDRARDLGREIQQLEHKRSRIVGRHQVHHGQRGTGRAYYVGQRRFETRQAADAYRKDHGGTVRVVATSRAEASRLGELSAVKRQIAAKDKRRRETLAKARELEKELTGGRPQLREGRRIVALNDKVAERALKTVVPGGEKSAAGKILDKVQGGWKLAATMPNPGFHLRNFAGDLNNAYAGQSGRRLPGNAVRAGRTLKQIGRQEKALAKTLGPAKPPPRGVLSRKTGFRTPRYGDISYDRVSRELIKAGAVRSGFQARELHDLLNPTGKVRAGRRMQTFKRWLNNREDIWRTATAIDALRRGATFEEAAARAARFHFDYSDVTEIERKILRRIFPFYTFSARNIPLQIRVALTNPGKFAAYQKLREELAGYFGYEDGWEQDLSEYEQRAAPLPITLNGKQVTLSLGPSGLPLTDLNEFPLVDGDPIKTAEEWMARVVSLTTPLVKTPVEISNNFSFFFRDQIERDEGPLVPAPSFVSKFPKKVRQELGIVPDYVDKRTGKKQWGWPAKVGYAFGVLPGPANFAMRYMTPSERAGQDGKNKLLGYMGFRVRPIDELTTRITNLYDERAELDKQQKALNQRGISADNPTPLYDQISARIKSKESEIFRLRNERGDKIIPGGRKPKPAATDAAGKALEALDKLEGKSKLDTKAVDDALSALDKLEGR